MKKVNLYGMIHKDTKEFISFISGSDDKLVITQFLDYHKDIIRSINDKNKLQDILTKIKDVILVRLGSLDCANVELGITPEFTVVLDPQEKLFEKLVNLRVDTLEREAAIYGD